MAQQLLYQTQREDYMIIRLKQFSGIALIFHSMTKLESHTYISSFKTNCQFSLGGRGGGTVASDILVYKP